MYIVLGVTIDQNMNWKLYHIDKITTKVSSLIGLLYRLGPCINKHCMLLFYNLFILSLFDFCINIWEKAADVHIQGAISEFDKSPS